MPKRLARIEPELNQSWETRCYENLCLAIILRAIDDVLEAEIALTRPHIPYSHARYNTIQKKVNAIQFLKSEWFMRMNPTQYSGMELLALARKHRSLYGSGPWSECALFGRRER